MRDLRAYIEACRKAGQPLELATMQDGTGWDAPRLFRALQTELTPLRNYDNRTSATYRTRPAHTPRALQETTKAGRPAETLDALSRSAEDAAPVFCVTADIEARLQTLLEAVG